MWLTQLCVNEVVQKVDGTKEKFSKCQHILDPVGGSQIFNCALGCLMKSDIKQRQMAEC